MNVKELIAELQKCNPEAIVIYANMEFFEVDGVVGRDSKDLKIESFDAPNVPVSQAKAVIIY